MADLLDYILWRGDIPFEIAPLNEIDCLIFAQLSYIKLDSIVEGINSKNTITLAQASNQFFTAQDFHIRSDNGPLINKKTQDLFRTISTTRRFKDIELYAYENTIDTTTEKQFSAVSFLLPNKTVFIAFRGTDDTLIGWKEDFNMAFLTPIPAQQDAVNYVNTIAASKIVVPKSILIGGHSKGGNLAIYAAAKCNPKAKQRLVGIYNYDGPGFARETLDTPEFVSIKGLVHSFIPEMSIVGMLFEQEGTLTVVESTEKGIMQHDPFSWVLHGPQFHIVNGIALSSHVFDKTVKTLLGELDLEKRRILINTIAEIIQASKAQKLSDLQSNFFENSVAIISAMSKVDPHNRDVIINIIKALFRSATSALLTTYNK